MKVLSIKEPYASLIKEGFKKIETRSYNTNYRGVLYIHASKDLFKDDRNLHLLLDEVHCGKIICKCKLVDSIYMTSDYVKKMQKENPNEYKYGYYEVGRYAWVFEDIEKIKPIKAKGNLGIWNYYKLDEVLKFMKNISYKEIDEGWHLQSAKKVIENRVGTFFDQVELERYYLKTYEIKTYALKIKNLYKHAFLMIKYQNKFYWIENVLLKFKGLHVYNDFDSLILDIKNKLSQYYGINASLIYIKEYKKLKSGLNYKEIVEKIEK